MIRVTDVSHRYGDRIALDHISLELSSQEIFGLLGPNGGGKSTLLKLLSTLLPVQAGQIEIAQHNVMVAGDAVRRSIAVTFQSPSLDGKLTVHENLRHQGHLYGLIGKPLVERIESVVARMGIADRLRDTVEKLSGGLKRRVEIAKCLLHAPQVLLLDEPSTGLDPGARYDLWEVLQGLRRDAGVTLLVTTHLMEEADRCDRLGILDQGRLIAVGTPEELRAAAGGEQVTLDPVDLEELEAKCQRQGWPVQRVGHLLRLTTLDGADLVGQIARTCPGEFRSLTWGRPSLEDTFIRLTGRRLTE